MRQPVERRTCDLCLARSVSIDGDGLVVAPCATPNPSYEWQVFNGYDICPYCAQLLERAIYLELVAWKPVKAGKY